MRRDMELVPVHNRPMGASHTDSSREGADFLDTVRDPETWETTKKGARQAAGFTIELLKILATGLIKKQIEIRLVSRFSALSLVTV